MNRKELSQLHFLNKEIEQEKQKLSQLESKYNRIIQNIDTIEDEWMRKILTLHYVNGLSWEEVSCKLGGGNKADSIRKRCYRFLKK